MTTSTGSSPPARGTQPDAVARRYIARFIPARAGNTLSYPSTTW